MFRKLILAALLSSLAWVAQAKTFNVAWSHYTGWEPWGYADSAGILKKWADKEGISIKLTLVNDYIESINLYTSGQFDACVMTNMDALTIPAVGGIDSQVIIVGDFSNGNDGIVIKNGKSVADMKGRSVHLVELSVSHYLLARALDKNNMTEKDIKLVNTSDSDIASVFLSSKDAVAVTWNPPLQTVRNVKGANMIFDSSQIPGEIIDVMVVKTKADDKLKRALTGAWYETMAIMNAQGNANKDMIEAMAKQSGATAAEFRAQIKTTAMFYEADKAVAFTKGSKLKETMNNVRNFTFSKGLFGRAKSVDDIGIELDDGSVLGSNKNVKLRFTSRYMQMAVDGKLK